MKDKLKTLSERYLELLDSQHFIEKDLDYSVLENHIPFLEKLNILGTSSISVFDLFKKKHVYISSNYEEVFKWQLTDIHHDDIDFFQKHVHPDDYIKLVESGIYFLSLGLSLKGAIKKDYKVVNEYRVMHADRHWVNVIEQHCLLEHDIHKNIWLALSIVDLSPDQNMNKDFCSRAINYVTGEVFAFTPEQTQQMINNPLTLREKEILKLLSDGLLSKEIADNLCISINTVNTHRQRILEKLDAGNTREAIKYAELLRII